MSFCSEQFLTDMDEILLRCDHILEDNFSDEELSVIKRDMEELRKQSTLYHDNLRDQIENSRLELSRKLAAIVLREDEEIERFFEAHDSGNKSFILDMSAGDINEIALFVEYLSGRARQAFRDAMMGAIHLKLLAETKIKKDIQMAE